MVRTKSLSIYLSCLVLLMSSCSRDVNTEDPILSDSLTESSLEGEGAEVFQRSSSEAIAIAKSFLGATEDLRSIDDAQLSLDFVAPSSKRKLRATDGSSVTPVDTPLFIINVPNEGGFFLVSGDTRMPDLLAAVEHGNLDKNNVDANTGLAVFLSRLPIYYENQLKAGKGPIPGDHIDPDEDDLYNPLKDSFPRYGMWESYKLVGPLVKTHWDQGFPFNKQSPEIRGELAAAGCVNIAFAQLIAFHRKPNSFRGLALDWELLTNSKEQAKRLNEFETMVASLCRKIGDATNTKWGLAKEGGSAANSRDIPKILSKEMGYSHSSSMEDYDTKCVLISLEEENPVPIVVRGDEEKITHGWWIFKYNSYKGGHSWLVDGLLKQKRLVERVSNETKKVISSHMAYRTLIHCNWGWGSRYDGYYTPGVFDQPHSVLQKASLYSRPEKDSSYFKYNLSCIRGIRP